jgi:hypothetical protein
MGRNNNLQLLVEGGSLESQIPFVAHRTCLAGATRQRHPVHRLPALKEGRKRHCLQVNSGGALLSRLSCHRTSRTRPLRKSHRVHFHCVSPAVRPRGGERLLREESFRCRQMTDRWLSQPSLRPATVSRGLHPLHREASSHRGVPTGTAACAPRRVGENLLSKE